MEEEVEEEEEVKEEKAKAEEYEEDRRLMFKYIYKIILFFIF